MSYNSVLSASAAPLNKTISVKRDALNGDIIDAIHSALPLGARQAKEIAQKFKQDSRKKTAFAVWRFLRNVAVYQRDENKNQNIRLPRRFVHDTFKKANSGDCKSFSLFSASIFSALGIPVYFVYAGYKNNSTPSHVYTMIEDEQGKKIIVDGCFYKFDSEKKPTFKKIYKMNINYLAGTELPGVEKISLSRYSALHNLRNTNPEKFKALCLSAERLATAKAQRAALYGVETINRATAEQKAKRKAKAKAGAKKFLWGIAFINLIPIRAAFNAIVALNINGLASNLKYLQDSKNPAVKPHWDHVLRVWSNVGGLKKALLKSIQLGAKHKPLFLSKKRKKMYEERHKNLKGFAGAEFIGDDGNIGNPAIVAAAVAAASGIIAAIIPAIMKGLKGGGQTAAAEDVAQQGAELVQEAKAPGYTERVASGAETEADAESIEGIAADYSSLVDALGEVAKVGITAAGNAIAKKAKKNPKTQQFLEKAAQAGDDYVTGAYLRRAGYTDRAKELQKSGALTYLPYAVGAVGLLGVVYAVATRKSSK